MIITKDFLNKLIELAKCKKDGIYSKNGFYYRVVNKNLCFIGSKVTGEVCQVSYNFLVSLGKCKTWELKKKLGQLII